MDCLVRKGFAIRNRKTRLTPARLAAAIDQLLADENAQRKAREFQKVVQAWDDPAIVRRFFRETFLPDLPL